MESRLFLDSANVEEIDQLLKTTAIGGVTTNPSLVSKEQKSDYLKFLELILQTTWNRSSSRRPVHLSIEVSTLDPKEMIQQAHRLSQLFDRFRPAVDLHIKIPVFLDTLEVITQLSRSSIKINATACMTTAQAKLAAAAGASVVSFFYNRMKDWALSQYNPSMSVHHNLLSGYIPNVISVLPFEEPEAYSIGWATKQIKHFKSLSDVPVICGSIRKAEDVFACWEAGAEFVTVSKKIICEMIDHPKTTEAINQFQKDIETWQS